MALAMAMVATNTPGDFDKPRRRRRTLTKVDPLMNREKREIFFWQPAARSFKENGLRLLLHSEWLLKNDNKFRVVDRIMKAADKFQHEHKNDEALYQKPVLRAIADEINKEYAHLGDKLVTDAYNEDVVDYSKYINSPLDDPEEVIEMPGPRSVNGFDWCERTDWKGKDSGDPGWVTHMKRKDIVWMNVQDNTREYRPLM